MNISKRTRQLALCALLVAIIIIMTFTPLGYIRVPVLAIQITTIHVPVMVGAALLGPAFGALLGLVFGLSSLTSALISPTPMSMIILQSFTGILGVIIAPRILCGWVAGLIFRAFGRRGAKHGYFGAAVSAIAGTMTNTIFFLSMLVITNPAQILGADNATFTAAMAFIGAIVVSNSIFEVAIATAVTTGVYAAGRPFFLRDIPPKKKEVPLNDPNL